MKLLRAFLADAAAATAIEYALIAAGIAGTIIVTVNNTGASVLNAWTQVSAAIQ
jgi:pilus assembly protein Flp/PilA